MQKSGCIYTERKKKRRVNFIPKFHSSLKKFVKYLTMITKRYMYGTKVPNFIGLWSTSLELLKFIGSYPPNLEIKLKLKINIGCAPLLLPTIIDKFLRRLLEVDCVRLVFELVVHTLVCLWPRHLGCVVWRGWRRMRPGYFRCGSGDEFFLRTSLGSLSIAQMVDVVCTDVAENALPTPVLSNGIGLGVASLWSGEALLTG